MKKSANPKHRSQKSRKRISKKRYSRKQTGGGNILHLELPRVGGQAVNMGYEQCCPPLYQNGQLAYTANGNQMCGGGKIRKRLHKS
jgi:hypothetical protein